jgi:nicotinamidase-related amidase
MPSPDLHGSAPDSCRLALLLVDVINDFDFPEAPQLLRTALPAARRIAALTARARKLKVPVVYANDNFGRWRSDQAALVKHCLRAKSAGRTIVEKLRPRRNDYFVIKPKHSAFFASTLETLLRYLEVERVILAGFAGNICVLFTANDLYMRDYRMWVPEDCCASNTEEANRSALEEMRTVLKADVRPSAELDLKKLIGRRR